jgi:hypothetical protein
MMIKVASMNEILALAFLLSCTVRLLLTAIAVALQVCFASGREGVTMAL